MYRLYKLKNMLVLQNLVLHSNNVPNSKSEVSRICSSCHKFHGAPTAFVRNLSTKSNPNVQLKKHRKKRKAKSYSDVLVVTNQSMVQEKATVNKLSPSDIKVFATTNLNLSEFYKLKNFKKQLYIEHTYNNLTVTNNISVIPDTSTNIILDVANGSDVRQQHKNQDLLNQIKPDRVETQQSEKVKIELVSNIANVPEDHELIHEDVESQELLKVKAGDLDNLKSPKPLFHPETLEEEQLIEENEIQKSKPESFEKTIREEVISRTLAAYTEVCSYLKTPQRGLNALMFHRTTHARDKFQKSFPTIKNINVYNSILKGFAARGNFAKIQEVLQYTKEDKLSLNVQTFAIIFECLGRCNVKDSHIKQIRLYGKEAFRQNFSFDRIMNEAVFLGDQRAMALKAIRCYDSAYEISLTKPEVQYANTLVTSLNNDKQLEPFALQEKVQNGKLQELIKKQLELEKEGSLTIKSVEAKSNPTKETLRYREIFSEHTKMWEKDALKGFTRDLQAVTARRGTITIEPYLRTIPTKDFIQIIVDEAKKLAQGSETYSPTCHLLYKQLGCKVYERYTVLRKQKMAVLDKIVDIHTAYCSQHTNFKKKNESMSSKLDYFNTRQQWQWIEYLHKNEGSTVLTDHQPWVPTAIQNIGRFLYQIIMQDLKIDVNSMTLNSNHKNLLPAFYTIFRTENHVMKEEVKPHPVLSKLYRASVPETLSFSISEMPMICPPIPWCSPITGGYLVVSSDLVRLPFYATTQRQRLNDASPESLYPSIDSLNQLSAVPWKVNTRILDIILEVFNSGGSAQLNVPEPPSSLPPIPRMTSDMSKSQKYQLYREKMLQKRRKAEMYSLWCDCLYRLSLANHFRNDTFWLPHNMDFRGRVYPIPPHLNHLGSDLARSMLVFAEAKPLGPKGLDWLKLHAVNLTGLKKRDCITDRLIFANEVMDKILDSADHPLTGKRWWAESEEPWQTLACCMEIAAAHRSENPEEYLSTFPVHQDGSCNGLQHYAALGRDCAGAYSVNLAPSRTPQDVYNAVVELVEKQREKDATQGVVIAKLLEGFIKRKVIKQTIMTTVYGVTRFGARLQIAKQLKDIESFPKDQIFAASNYLTTRTFESLRTMFTSTREIQDWFTDCARLISSIRSENVEWVTPLGLPIVQPYSRMNSNHKKGFVYEHYSMDKYEVPNVMKQKNAFPPNFIHSLDSSHMMLTSLFCERADITFVSVHDCYWTHPSTVSAMNKICREQFLALHSQPILENLSSYFSEKFGSNNGKVVGGDWTLKKLDRVLNRVPKTGDFDINQVLESVYFFS